MTIDMHKRIIQLKGGDNMAKINTSTALDIDVYNTLEDYCRKTGESKASVFERALKDWFEKLETGGAA